MRAMYGSFVAGRAAWGLLAVRLIFGSALMLHGWQKVTSGGGPMGWMGPKAPVPGFFQGLATLSEFGGGLALVFGLLTPLAALGIAITMLVAMATALAHAPFVSSGGGSSKESAAGYFAVALLLIFSGPGVHSLDALLFNKRRENDGMRTATSSPDSVR